MTDQAAPQITESPTAACASLLHFIICEKDVRRRALMLRDLTHRADDLSRDRRNQVLAAAAEAFSTRPPEVRFRAPAIDEELRRVDVLIVAVVDIERRAVLEVFDIVDDDPATYEVHRGQRFYRTTVASQRTGRQLSVAVTTFGRALNVRSAVASMRLRQRYDADAFFLLGMAAGVPGEVVFGDVVVPEAIRYYEPGRSLSDKFEPRAEVEPVYEPLHLNLRYYDIARSPSYGQRLHALVARSPADLLPSDLPDSWMPAYKINNTILMSGEKLLRDDRLVEERKRFDERIIAGDQESYGVAEALRGSRWAVLRGIADYGDPEKTGRWQYAATLAAGLALRDFLESQYEPEDRGFM